MNERIKELAEQAEISRLEYNPYTMMTERIQEFDKQKFAELIIQECVGVADDYVKDCTCDEHKNCKHPRSAIGRKIKQHFGVNGWH